MNTGYRQKPMYTKEEMLTCARANGFAISETTFQDWIKVGLLGNAKERDWPGKGHGSGSIGCIYHLQINVTVSYQNNPLNFSFTLPYV